MVQHEVVQPAQLVQRKLHHALGHLRGGHVRSDIEDLGGAQLPAVPYHLLQEGLGVGCEHEVGAQARVVVGQLLADACTGPSQQHPGSLEASWVEVVIPIIGEEEGSQPSEEQHPHGPPGSAAGERVARTGLAHRHPRLPNFHEDAPGPGPASSSPSPQPPPSPGHRIAHLNHCANPLLSSRAFSLRAATQSHLASPR